MPVIPRKCWRFDCACPVVSARSGDGFTLHHDAHSRLHDAHGPAWTTRTAEGDEGARYWFRHGVPHRLDGPAVEGRDHAQQQWFLEGADASPESVAEAWLATHDPGLAPAAREVLFAALHPWPAGATLAVLHAAVTAAA